MISFCRLRPADQLNELWAATRRREGTTVVETPDETDRTEALRGGLLSVATTPVPGAAAWVVSPDDAIALANDGARWWQLTVLDSGHRASIIEALAQAEAAYLRTGRSRVSAAAELVALPGMSSTVSVFVDSVEEAVAAIAAGAGDLLLRDWDTERIGALRDALDGNLVERTAFPPGIDLDDARETLDEAAFTTYLGHIDGSGAARPRYEWAPGKELAPPLAEQRISAEWTDRAWVNGVAPAGLDAISPDRRRVLQNSLDGMAPSRQEIELLFASRGDEVDTIATVADELRRRANGDTVTYVINRNINYTNQCYFRCGFCAFSKGPRSLNLRGDPYLLEVHEVAYRTKEAWDRGATEVCLQGGIHPDFTGDFYLSVLRAVKEAAPDMHVHGFTPLEVWQGAETLGKPVAEFLAELKDAGLATLPGTAAEILDDSVRRFLCPDKIRTSQWAEVMITAHELGMRSTSTMMFGHIDGPASWANHLEVLRQIQRRTGGITEFVPLPFVHMGAPIFLRGHSRPGPTWDEVVLVHAVARIALDGLIPNIQASWVKLGLEGGARLLNAGCNDLGGTLMDENISRAAGAAHGQLATPEDLEATIRSVGRTPSQRTTLYEPVGQRVDG